MEAYRLEKGMKKAYDKMSEAEKVQLRFEYIMKQTADAQGDFNRTQDSYANQLRLLSNNIDTLAANVGKSLIPALTSAVQWINALFGGGSPDGNSQLVGEINGTIERLNELEKRVASIKNQYAEEVITIQVDYDTASDALTKLEELQDRLGRFGSGNLQIGADGEDVKALQETLTELGYLKENKDGDGVFGEDTLAAVKAFQENMNLAVDGIVGVKTRAALAEPDLAALVAVTEHLVTLYPQLAEYVGENGLLKIEADKVRELTTEYRNLALEKALATRDDALSAEYYNSLIDLKVLEEKRKEAEKELAQAQTKLDELKAAGENLSESYRATNTWGDDIMNRPTISTDTKDIEKARDALQSYMDVYGELPDTIRKAAEEKGYDMSALLNLTDGAGSELLSPEELAKSTASLEALYGVIQMLAQDKSSVSLDGFDYTNQVDADINATNSEIYGLQTAITDADTAIENASSSLETLNKEIEYYKEAAKSLTAEAEDGGADAGKAMADQAGKTLGNETGVVVSGIKKLIAAAQAEADNMPVKIRTVFSSLFNGLFDGRSHATGLGYVPYNGYAAKLHVGEAVLTASEAKAWRARSNDGIDYQALADAVIAAQSKSGAQTPVVLTIDGRELARTQAEYNHSAITNYERRLSAGRGKR